MGLLFISCRLVLLLFLCPSTHFKYADSSRWASLSAQNSSLGNSASQCQVTQKNKTWSAGFWCRTWADSPHLGGLPSPSWAAPLGSRWPGPLFFPEGTTPTPHCPSTKPSTHDSLGTPWGAHGYQLTSELVSKWNMVHDMGFWGKRDPRGVGFGEVSQRMFRHVQIMREAGW